MTELSYRLAVGRALSEEMRRDPSVVLFGEDVAAAGGVFKATEGLLGEFGPERVRDTPISEQAIIGAAIGAALAGLRPVVELMFADFVGVAFDQLANQLAKYRYLSGGQGRLPVTVRLVNGAGAGFGGQHSQAAENWLLNVPGLRIAVPSTPADMYGLLKTAIRSDDPVLVFEHKLLYAISGEVPSQESMIPLGSAKVLRDGTDITVVGTQLTAKRAVGAAEALMSEGISAELIDPRTLSPFDWSAVFESVAKTGRLLVVQECPFAGSWGASVAAKVASERFETLRAGPAVISAPDTPIPFAGSLEGRWIPTEDDIRAAATRLCGRSP